MVGAHSHSSTPCLFCCQKQSDTREFESALTRTGTHLVCFAARNPGSENFRAHRKPSPPRSSMDRRSSADAMEGAARRYVSCPQAFLEAWVPCFPSNTRRTVGGQARRRRAPHNRGRRRQEASAGNGTPPSSLSAASERPTMRLHTSTSTRTMRPHGTLETSSMQAPASPGDRPQGAASGLPGRSVGQLGRPACISLRRSLLHAWC